MFRRPRRSSSAVKAVAAIAIACAFILAAGCSGAPPDPSASSIPAAQTQPGGMTGAGTPGQTAAQTPDQAPDPDSIREHSRPTSKASPTMVEDIRARLKSPENPARQPVPAVVHGEITDEAEFQRRTYRWLLKVSQYEERVATEVSREYGVSRDVVAAMIDELRGRGDGRLR